MKTYCAMVRRDYSDERLMLTSKFDEYLDDVLDDLEQQGFTIAHCFTVTNIPEYEDFMTTARWLRFNHRDLDASLH